MNTHRSPWTISFFAASAFFVSSAAGDESATEPTQLSGWQLTAPGDDRFEASRDQNVTFDGKATARLQTTVTTADLGSLVQSVDAEKYRGKRIRFATNAKIKGVEGGTGAWLRINDPWSHFRVFADTHETQLKGNSDWTRLSIVVDVPKEAKTVYLGLSQDGPGTSWFGPVSVEAVDDTVPLTSRPGSRIYAGVPILCSKTAPTGSHIRQNVCFNLQTGRTQYLSLPEYVRGIPLSGTRVENPRGWLWIWG